MKTHIPRGQSGRPVMPSPWAGRPGESAAHPRPGYWRIRLAKGAPLVVCCIREVEEPQEDVWWEGSPNLAAFILDQPTAMARVWMWKGQEITESEYRYQCALAAHCREHEPGDPLASPRRAVDLTTLPPIGPE